MNLGKISYINLLPFDVFIKGYPLHSSERLYLLKRGGYPARLNDDMFFSRMDASFISSIAGMKLARSFHDIATIAGINAEKRVLSVLALRGDGSDFESATSNALLKALDLKGQVLIGDKALEYYYERRQSGEPLDFIDLASAWYRRYRLPFVFGHLVAIKHTKKVQRLAASFVKKRVRPPSYMLEASAARVGLSRGFILEYLGVLSYKITPKHKRALALFAHNLLVKNIPLPRRNYHVAK